MKPPIHKIIKNDEIEFIKEFYDLELFSNIKRLYPRIKYIKYVPEITIYDNKIRLPYCGDTISSNINLDVKIKTIIKTQIIDFIKQLYEAQIAHRDLATHNICWDGTQIWVIDWDTIIEHKPRNILEHYDLTCQGLPVPSIGRTWIFRKCHTCISTWLHPVSLTLNDFK